MFTVFRVETSGSLTDGMIHISGLCQATTYINSCVKKTLGYLADGKSLDQTSGLRIIFSLASLEQS